MSNNIYDITLANGHPVAPETLAKKTSSLWNDLGTLGENQQRVNVRSCFLPLNPLLLLACTLVMMPHGVSFTLSFETRRHQICRFIILLKDCIGCSEPFSIPSEF